MSLPTDLILYTWSFCDTKTLLCGCLVVNREWSECIKANLSGPIADAMAKFVRESVLNRYTSYILSLEDRTWKHAKPLAVAVREFGQPPCTQMMQQLDENCPSPLGFSTVPELLRQFQSKHIQHGDLIGALTTNVEIMVFNVESQLHLYQQHWKKNYACRQHESDDYVTTQLQRYKSIPKLEDFSASTCDCSAKNGIECKYHALEKILLHKDVCRGTECEDYGCLTIQRRHFIQTNSLKCSYCQRQDSRVTLEFRRPMFPLLLSPSSHLVHQPRVKCESSVDSKKYHGNQCYCTWDFCDKNCAWNFMLDHALRADDGHFLVPCVHFLFSLQRKWHDSFEQVPINSSPASGFIKVGAFTQDYCSYDYEYSEHLLGLCDPATCTNPSLMKLNRRCFETCASFKRQRKH